MKKPNRSFFEAHQSQEIPEDYQTIDALQDYLHTGYGISNAMRAKSFTQVVGDILQNTPEAVKLSLELENNRSEELKLRALFTRLAYQEPKSMLAVELGISPEELPWHSFKGNTRWHALVITDYQKDEATGEIVNNNASISNFPAGGSHITEKMRSDHRINYFLWSLREGLSTEEKAQLPHLQYERTEEQPEESALSCQFARLLSTAEKLLGDCIADVEHRDPRYQEGSILPHKISEDHVEIVSYNLEQLLFHMRGGHLHHRRQYESLRAELIKSAMLNMVSNGWDGIKKVDRGARSHIPLQLNAVLALSSDDPYTQQNEEAVRYALSSDFDIEPKEMPNELMALAERLAACYIAERGPANKQHADKFEPPHRTIRALAYHAALLLHDSLNNVPIRRQVSGDTTAEVSAYAGIKSFSSGGPQPTASHWKFYLNRYAAIFYGYTDGYTLEQGVDSYYQARRMKRSVVERFYRECRQMHSTMIARVVPLLAPEYLLYSSSLAIPGAKVVWHADMR